MYVCMYMYVSVPFITLSLLVSGCFLFAVGLALRADRILLLNDCGVFFPVKCIAKPGSNYGQLVRKSLLEHTCTYFLYVQAGAWLLKVVFSKF